MNEEDMNDNGTGNQTINNIAKDTAKNAAKKAAKSATEGTAKLVIKVIGAKAAAFVIPIVVLILGIALSASFISSTVSSNSNLDDLDDTTSASNGKSNLEDVPGKIADYLLGKGMSVKGVAAILGNIEQECSFNSSNVSGNYIGICQWGLEYNGQPSRGTNLKNYAQQKGKDWTDLGIQLDFMWKELKSSGYSAVKKKMMNADDVNSATEYFARHFEKCINSDGSLQQIKERKEFAQKWYEKLKKSATINNTQSSSESNESIDNAKRNKIISIAKSKLGCKYKFGGKGPNSFDCSGFVNWVYKKAGINVPSSTAGYSKTSKHVINVKDAKPGDILHIYQGEDGRDNGHVAIYLDKNTTIEAMNAKYGVCNGKVGNKYKRAYNYIDK